METSPYLIKLSGVSYGYPGRPMVLDNISFSFSKGERIGLVGANGSGKTTLFHLIMGLLTPLSGVIELYGKTRKKESDFREVRARTGLMFQNSDDQLFCPTVAEDVSFGPLNLGKTHQQAKEITRQVLRTVGLEGFENRVTYKLSEGEKKMVSLACILSMEPELLLLDEPSSGIDDTTSARIVNILKKSDYSYIIISHDKKLIRETTQGVYKLENGKLLLLSN